MPEPDGPTEYRVYTRSFDREVAARDLDAVLGPLDGSQRKAFDQTWNAYLTGSLGSRLAPDPASFDLASFDWAEAMGASVPADALADTVVSLLVDHSGSMRGRNIALAASAAEVAVEALSTLDVRVEVLGFTTVGWKGGRARQLWIRRGRPPHPGRLCDLLHVVHRSAEDRAPLAIHHMLRPGLLHENVDGEALEWAAGRLLARPEARKVIVVISDGAPVDDSTIDANGPNLLRDHLFAVRNALSREPGLTVAGIGIGHDVSRFYSPSRVLLDPDGIGSALLEVLREALVGTRPPAPATPDA